MKMTSVYSAASFAIRLAPGREFILPIGRSTVPSSLTTSDEFAELVQNGQVTLNSEFGDADGEAKRKNLQEAAQKLERLKARNLPGPSLVQHRAQHAAGTPTGRWETFVVKTGQKLASFDEESEAVEAAARASEKAWQQWLAQDGAA